MYLAIFNNQQKKKNLKNIWQNAAKISISVVKALDLKPE